MVSDARDVSVSSGEEDPEPELDGVSVPAAVVSPQATRDQTTKLALTNAGEKAAGQVETRQVMVLEDDRIHRRDRTTPSVCETTEAIIGVVK